MSFPWLLLLLYLLRGGRLFYHLDDQRWPCNINHHHHLLGQMFHLILMIITGPPRSACLIAMSSSFTNSIQEKEEQAMASRVLTGILLPPSHVGGNPTPWPTQRKECGGKWNQQPGSLFHNLCLPRLNTDKEQHNGHIRRKRGSEGSTPVQGLTGQPKHRLTLLCWLHRQPLRSLIAANRKIPHT